MTKKLSEIQSFNIFSSSSSNYKVFAVIEKETNQENWEIKYNCYHISSKMDIEKKIDSIFKKLKMFDSFKKSDELFWIKKIYIEEDLFDNL
jgi:hypothetical protein